MRNSKSRDPHETIKTIQFIQTGSSFSEIPRPSSSLQPGHRIDVYGPLISVRWSRSLTSVPVIVGNVETPIDIPACVK